MALALCVETLQHMDVKLNCPRCGDPLPVDEKQGKGIVDCPTCKYQVNMTATLAAKQPASAVRSQPASQPPLQPLLVKCAECQHPVSTNAATCPNCGAPVKRESSVSGLRVLLIVVGVAVSLWVVGSIVGAIACGVLILLAAIAK